MGGCDCSWLSQDNCDDQSWCCAWACRNNYGNPQNCADPDGSEYGQIEWGDCDGGCECTWLSQDNCEDTDWCCAGACRDYYYNPKGCNGPALLANESGVNATLKGSDSPLCTSVWTCPAFQLCRWTESLLWNAAVVVASFFGASQLIVSAALNTPAPKTSRRSSFPQKMGRAYSMHDS